MMFFLFHRFPNQNATHLGGHHEAQPRGRRGAGQQGLGLEARQHRGIQEGVKSWCPVPGGVVDVHFFGDQKYWKTKTKL